MRPRLLLTPLKWLLTLGVLGGLVFGVFQIHRAQREERERDDSDEKVSPNSPQAIGGIIKLEDDEAERYGLTTEPARGLQWYEPETIYGRVIPNSRATTEIRSPFAGILRGSDWPAVGQWIRAGQTIGWVDIRIGPEVRLDLQTKLTEARVKQRGAEEEIKAQENRVNSLKAAAAQEIIARNELDAALVQLTQARTQLAAAKAAADQWSKALLEVEKHKDGGDSLWSQSLTALCAGEVTDLAGRPGLAVEPGASIAKLVDFRRPLIRLDFPLEIVVRSNPPSRLEVCLLSLTAAIGNGVRRSALPAPDPSSIRTRLIGPAPHAEAGSPLAHYLYEADLTTPVSAKEKSLVRLWRPGTQLTAQVRADPAAEQPAVSVPAESVLYHLGQPWVYVRNKAETYERRAVQILGRQGGRWILARRQGNLAIGVTPEEPVVSRQAQILLSKEFLVGTLDND